MGWDGTGGWGLDCGGAESGGCAKGRTLYVPCTPYADVWRVQ